MVNCPVNYKNNTCQRLSQQRKLRVSNMFLEEGRENKIALDLTGQLSGK